MPESEPPTGITAATRWGTYLHVPKTGFLADPHDVTSGLDHHVQAQLDSVHAETGASISAHSTPLLDSGQEDRIIGMAQGAGRSHLEENVKDAFASAQPLDRASIPRREGKLLIWITGSTIESVSLGRVGILVLADQVRGSSSIHVDIDPKLLPILAGRHRAMITRIEQDTGANIYLPTQLNGVFDEPVPGAPKHTGYHHFALPKPQYRPPPPIQGPQYRPRPMPMNQYHANGHHHHNGNGMHPQWAGTTMASPGSMGPWPTNGHLSPGPPPQHQSPNNPHTPHQYMPYPPNAHQPMHTQNRPAFQPYGPQHPSHPYEQQKGFHGVQHSPHPHHPHHVSPRPMWQSPQQLPPQSNANSAHPPFDNHAVTFPGFLSPSPNLLHNGTNGHQQPIRPQNGHVGHASPIHLADSRRSSLASQRSPTPLVHQGPPHRPPPPSAGPFNAFPNPQHFQSHAGPGGFSGNPFEHPMFTPTRPPTYAPRKPKISEHAVEQFAIDRFGGRHPGLGESGSEQGSPGNAWRVWMTGPIAAIHTAKDSLLKAAAAKEFMVLSRDLAMDPERIDWILTNRLEQVRKIMDDNGTYIQVPVVGSKSEMVMVFGDHHTHIERSLRNLAQLASELYEATVWLLPQDDYTAVPLEELDQSVQEATATQISRESGAAVTFTPKRLEIRGTEQQVKAACEQVLSHEALAGARTKVVFRFELAKEFQAFYGGLRLGKMSKIKKAYAVNIELKPSGDYNFAIELSGPDRSTIDGFNAALEELPAQISFHIPEMYHRRIIGASGSNIQSIMSRFQCFIKCCSPEEQAALGGYNESQDNVLIYCPARNRGNIELAKQALMEMVAPEDRYHTSRPVQIDRYYHHMLSFENKMLLQDIARRTRTLVRFPYKETGSDTVTVYGPALGIDAMTRLILDILPTQADVQLPKTADLPTLVAAPEFDHFRRQVRAEHLVDITFDYPNIPGSRIDFALRGEAGQVESVCEVLNKVLKGHDFAVHATSPVPDPTTVANGRIGSHVDGTSIHNLMSDESKRPDLKAFFPETEGSSSLGNGNGLGFASPLDTPSSTNLAAAWQRTQPPSSQAGISGTRKPASKRDSDPIILRKLNRTALARLPRGSASRTQSLDVTHPAARRTFGIQDPGSVLEDDPAIIASSQDAAPLRQHNTGEARMGVDGITQRLYETRI